MKLLRGIRIILLQILLGMLTADYGTEGDSFYGIKSRIKEGRRGINRPGESIMKIPVKNLKLCAVEVLVGATRVASKLG